MGPFWNPAVLLPTLILSALLSPARAPPPAVLEIAKSNILVLTSFLRSSTLQFERLSNELISQHRNVSLLLAEDQKLPFSDYHVSLGKDAVHDRVRILRIPGFKVEQELHKIDYDSRLSISESLDVAAAQMIFNSESLLASLREQKFTVCVIEPSFYADALCNILKLNKIRVVLTPLEPITALLHRYSLNPSYYQPIHYSEMLTYEEDPTSLSARITKVLSEPLVYLQLTLQRFWVHRNLGSNYKSAGDSYDVALVVLVGPPGVHESVPRPQNFKYVFPLQEVPQEVEYSQQTIRALDSAQQVILIALSCDYKLSRFELSVFKTLFEKQGEKKYVWYVPFGCAISEQDLPIAGNVFYVKQIDQRLLSSELVQYAIVHCEWTPPLDFFRYGIPVLGYAASFEQYDICKRFKRIHAAEYVTREDFSAESLEIEGRRLADRNYDPVAFNLTVKNLEFYEKYFQRIPYWVDYVSRQGVDHLIPEYAGVHWFYYYQLHIILGTVAIIAFFGYFALKFVVFLLRLFIDLLYTLALAYKGWRHHRQENYAGDKRGDYAKTDSKAKDY